MSVAEDAPAPKSKSLSLADILANGNDEDGYEIVEMVEEADSNEDEDTSVPKDGYCVECEGTSSPLWIWIHFAEHKCL